MATFKRMSQGQQVKFYTVQKILCKPSKPIASPDQGELRKPNISSVSPKIIDEKKNGLNKERNVKTRDEPEVTRQEANTLRTKTSSESSSSAQLIQQEDKLISHFEPQSSGSSSKNSERRTEKKEFEMPEFKQKLSELKSLEETLKKNEGSGAARKTNQNRDINYFLERRNTPRSTPKSIKIDDVKLQSSEKVKANRNSNEIQSSSSQLEDQGGASLQEINKKTPSPKVQFKDEFFSRGKRTDYFIINQTKSKELQN